MVLCVMRVAHTSSIPSLVASAENHPIGYPESRAWGWMYRYALYVHDVTSLPARAVDDIEY